MSMPHTCRCGICQQTMEPVILPASTLEPCPALRESGGAWMIVFDDREVKPETFSGAGAEAAAKRRFQQISGQWNAHLFARVGVNSFDAVLAASPQPPGDDARDAVRYRWLRENGNSFFNACHYRGTGGVFDAQVDSALTKQPEAPPGADAHPEAYCEQCGRPNAVWFAPSEIWNVACRDSSILCPVCFIWKTEAAGVKPTSWMVAPEGYSAPQSGETP